MKRKKFRSLQEWSQLSRVATMMYNYERVTVGVYDNLRKVYRKLGVHQATKEQVHEELGLFFEYEMLEPTYYSNGKVKTRPIKITRIKSEEEVEVLTKGMRTTVKSVKSQSRISQKQQQLEPIGEHIFRKGVYLITNEDGKEMYVGYTLDCFRDRLHNHYSHHYEGKGNKGSELLVTDPKAKMYWLCLFDEDNLPTRQHAEHIEQQFITLVKHQFGDRLVNKDVKKYMSLPNVDDVNIPLLVELGIMEVA